MGRWEPRLGPFLLSARHRAGSTHSVNVCKVKQAGNLSVGCVEWSPFPFPVVSSGMYCNTQCGFGLGPWVKPPKSVETVVEQESVLQSSWLCEVIKPITLGMVHSPAEEMQSLLWVRVLGLGSTDPQKAHKGN